MTVARLVRLFLVSILLTTIIFVLPAVAATVTGTVTYGGTSTGQRIYVTLSSQFGTLGTSVPGTTFPQTFSIAGVPEGAYTVRAFLDSSDTGNRHATDPVGQTTIPFSVLPTSTTVSAGTITLTDPIPITTVPAPTGLTVSISGSGQAIVDWDTGGGSQGEIADFYNIYWSTDPAVGPTVTTGGGSKTGIAANGSSGAIITGLPTAVPIYFTMTAKLGTMDSPAATPVQVTVPSPTAGYTVTGTITFPSLPNAATLYVILVDKFTGTNTEKLYMGEYPLAVGLPSQAYAIPNVPSGTYQAHAWIDLNGTGVIDIGDWMTPEDASSIVTVSGADLTKDFTVSNAAAAARVTTGHFYSGTDLYTVGLHVTGLSARPVSVTLIGAPASTGLSPLLPMDIGTQGWGYMANIKVPAPPVASPPDVYTFTVTDSTGTPSTVTASVTGVMTGFAAPLFPVGRLASYDGAPMFSWTTPPAAAYGLAISLSGDNNSTSWDSVFVSASTPDVPYNFDNSANTPSLPNAGSFTWGVTAMGPLGNYSYQEKTFWFPGTPLSVNTMGLPGGTQGAPYSQSLTASGGITPYTWTVPTGTLPSGLTLDATGLISGTPLEPGTVPFTVQVTDSSGTPLTATADLSITVSPSTPPPSGRYSVSGTISYTGSKAGRIYVILSGNGGRFGTSIGWPGTGPVSYTVHGVLPGTYTVTTFMDHIDMGRQVQTSPFGTASITVSGSPVTQDLILADEAAVPPPAPTRVLVHPGPGSVLIEGEKYTDSMVLPADAYNIYWSTSPDVMATYASNGSSRIGVRPGNDAPILITGLTDGASLYFVVEPVSGGVAGTASVVVGPVTIGATTGGNTVSGTVTYTGSPTGPLYVAVVDNTTTAGKVYYTVITAPSFPQSFTVSGIPDGIYSVYAVNDTNSDGIIGIGDVITGDHSAPILNLPSDAGASPIVPLVRNNAEAFVTTDHQPGYYNVEYGVKSRTKQVVAVTLTADPANTNPVDLAIEGDEFRQWFGGSVAPTIGDTYTFFVEYADGTSENLSAQVTGVLDSFPTSPLVSGTTFSWGAPATPPANYRYSLYVQQGATAGNSLWDTDLPSSILSVPYGGKLLAPSTTYSWTISVIDQYRNRASVFSNFTTASTVDTTPPDITLYSSPGSITNQTSATFSFSSTDVTASFQCSLDGGVFTTCWSPATHPGLTAGAHTFTVQATDPAGNVSGPASYTWSIDTTPPDVTISGTPAPSTNLTSASFSFSSTDASAMFQCSLDGAAFTACPSPATYTTLAAGSHTFAVQATDPAGNISSPASYTWTIDTIPPDVTISSTVGSVTNLTSATFSFSSTDVSAMFQCSLDGAAFTACPSPATYTALAAGSHTFAVQATDPVGNISSPAFYTWAIDTTPPDVTLSGTPASLTNLTSATFSFSSTDLTATFQCSLDGATFTACPSPATYTALAAGTHTFTVQAIDPAGNITTTPPTFTWVIDTSVLSVSLTSSVTGPSKAPMPVSVVFSKPVSDFSSASVTLTNATLSAFTGSGTTYSFDAVPTATGTVSVGISAGLVHDAAGNTNTASNVLSLAADLTPPNVTITSMPASSTNQTSAAFSFSSLETGATFICTLDTGSPVPCSSGVSFTSLAPNAAHSFTVMATDPAGNVSSPASYTWSIDTIAPDTALVTTPASLSNVSAATFTFASSDTSAVFQCSLDGASFSPCVSGTSYSGLSDGSHMFKVQTVDPAGNVSPTPAAFGWSIDTATPVVSITSPTGTSSNTTPLLSYSTSDGTVAVQLDGTTISTANNTNLSTLADGVHTIVVQAVDSAGNIGTATVSFTVDTTKPDVLITGSPTTLTTQRSATFNFSSTDSTTVFRCSIDGSSFIPCSSGVSYSSLAPAPHTFKVEAVDPAGNAAGTSFTWTIDTKSDGDLTPEDGLNGTVTIADALKALRMAVGEIAASPEELVHGDVAPLVNGYPQPDGKIDIGDAVVLLRRVVGLVKQW